MSWPVYEPQRDAGKVYIGLLRTSHIAMFEGRSMLSECGSSKENRSITSRRDSSFKFISAASAGTAAKIPQCRFVLPLGFL